MDCPMCLRLGTPGALYDDGIWQVRPHEAPGVPGWMMLVTCAHRDGLVSLDDLEARTLGPMLRHFERLLLEVTGAEKIYTAMLGEAVPHFHAHLVPRRADQAARGWSLFELERAANEGRIIIETGEVARLSAAYANAIASRPPRDSRAVPADERER